VSGERRGCLVEAAAALDRLEDGMTLAVGAPAPMALVREVIRRGRRGLTVIDSGLSLDLLIAAGCVGKVVSYYAGGGFGVPVAPSFRRAVERDEVEVWECEEGILTAGLQAAAQMLPFLPWRGGVGTSLPEVNPDLRVITDPIEGQTLLAVPAIRPDVAILHAAHADAYGNVQHVAGPGWLDLFLHRAADWTVVQVEKVIANETVRADPWATTIARADAVVRAPYGAHPFYSRGYYVQDQAHLAEYVQVASAAAREPPARDGLERYLRTYCIEPAGHADYLERIGIRRLLDLHEY
jgi:glutaconate CoA-transferase, subunit A